MEYFHREIFFKNLIGLGLFDGCRESWWQATSKNILLLAGHELFSLLG